MKQLINNKTTLKKHVLFFYFDFSVAVPHINLSRHSYYFYQID